MRDLALDEMEHEGVFSYREAEAMCLAVRPTIDDELDDDYRAMLVRLCEKLDHMMEIMAVEYHIETRGEGKDGASNNEGA